MASNNNETIALADFQQRLGMDHGAQDSRNLGELMDIINGKLGGRSIDAESANHSCAPVQHKANTFEEAISLGYCWCSTFAMVDADGDRQRTFHFTAHKPSNLNAEFKSAFGDSLDPRVTVLCESVMPTVKAKSIEDCRTELVRAMQDGSVSACTCFHFTLNGQSLGFRIAPSHHANPEVEIALLSTFSVDEQSQFKIDLVASGAPTAVFEKFESGLIENTEISPSVLNELSQQLSYLIEEEKRGFQNPDRFTRLKNSYLCHYHKKFCDYSWITKEELLDRVYAIKFTAELGVDRSPNLCLDFDDRK